MTRQALTAALAVAMLASCTTTADQRRTDPIAGESLASSVMRAADIQSHRDAPNEMSSAMRARGLGAVTGEDITSAGNIIFGGVSGALFSLTRERGGPDQFSQILAWPPLDYASNALDAQKIVWADLRRAVVTSLEANSDNYEIEILSGALTGVKGHSIIVNWNYEICDGMAFSRCQLSLYIQEDILPEASVSPAFLPIEERWSFERGNGAISFAPLATNTDFPPKRVAVVDEMTLYEDVSRNLPDWVFIYIAPFTAGYVPTGSDRLALYPAPVVLNQGLAYYFVEGQREGVPLIRDFGPETQEGAG